MQDTTPQNTKAALIRAAERLFAQRGLGTVSVREITRAAGARNESALHYHFGGMEALIREVFVSHNQEIEAARLAQLASLDAEGRSHDIEALMQAAVAPLFDDCRDAAGRLHAQFAVQLSTDPRFNVAELVREAGMESLLQIGERVLVGLSHLPEDIRLRRLRRLFTITTFLIADHAAQVEVGAAPPLDEAVREAAASLAGFLLAPA